jgi:hypothetical protein
MVFDSKTYKDEVVPYKQKKKIKIQCSNRIQQLDMNKDQKEHVPNLPKILFSVYYNDRCSDHYKCESCRNRQ